MLLLPPECFNSAQHFDVFSGIIMIKRSVKALRLAQISAKPVTHTAHRIHPA